MVLSLQKRLIHTIELAVSAQERFWELRVKEEM
jgi:hypothetical protein